MNHQPLKKHIKNAIEEAETNMNEFKTVVFSGGGSRCLWQGGRFRSPPFQTCCALKENIVPGR